MYYWDDIVGFKNMGMIDGINLLSDLIMIILFEFDFVGGLMFVLGVKKVWIYDFFIGVYDLRQLLIVNGVDMFNWDSFNQIDLIEDVNGVVYVIGFGIYKGVFGYKFFVVVLEFIILFGIGIGVVVFI